MNKVLSINLGGYPFTIDEDAFEHLDKYLKAIHKHFRHTEGYEEITEDIEARLAELFQSSMGNRPIVSFKDVEQAIATMGRPEEFGEGPLEDETVAGSRGEGSYKTGKRLFRNPDDEVVAGVCSGVAAYFGIQDPVWIRILFVIITISGGFGIPMYIVLWAILPQAETAGDRLAMRGEPINVSNIGKIIQEEVEHITEKVTELGEELGSKKKVLKETTPEEMPLRKGYL
ncbi:MAG: hypothetical protein DHS20C18_51200 [Saprospiraceae bacterium]|nr:MAG: hypothetical protein DHS20C18_51200 [Saprospiraceae bacterium]